ncbi:PAS domain-containing sensor histidine kinase [Hyphobacterium sp.]|uniref:PAS domain-containing sensor histidine kinase n=1 Tax=Hyphobacterium sp. TaxID=2004662 RepID=UPI003BAB02BE
MFTVTHMDESQDEHARILRLTEAYGKVGYWQVDLENESVFWSQEVFDIHGVPPEQGAPALADAINFYHPDDVAMVQQAVDAAAENGTPFQFYGARIQRPDGSCRRIFSRGEVSLGGNGQPIRIAGIFRDVTEEIEKAEAAQMAKSRLDLLVNSGVGIWEWDLVNDRVLVSIKLAELMGLPAQEITLSLDEFMSGMPEEDQRLVRKRLDTHLQQGQPYLAEHRATARDRGTIWLRSRAQAEFDSDGKPIRMVGWSEDITELRRSESESRTIFDSVPSMIWLKDDQNRILRLNKRAAESMGGAVEDFEGADTYDLFGEMAKKYHEDDLEVIENGSPITGTVERYMPEGKDAGWVYTDKIPLSSNGETLDQILVVSTDITALKNAEEALRESDGRFQLAASGASVGIWDWIDTNGDEEIWSDIFYQLIGYTRDELPASLTAFSDLLHPEDTKATFAAVDAHLTKREPFQVEYRLKHKTDGYRWFLGTGQASFDAEGNPLRMVGSIQDVHDQKLTSAKLVESNRELERFAYIASHDLQEPLRKINQFSALLESEYADELDGSGQIYLRFLMDASERMQQQIKDLLEYSRAGRAAVSRQGVDVEAVAQRVWDDHSETLSGLDAQLVIQEGAEIFADEQLVHRLLFNLIGNSIKYRSADRPLIVTVGVVSQNGEDRLSVSDNGIGFDTRHATEIFKIFSRLHRKEEYPGTGLGLALCERVMQLHEGEITAAATPGEGAVFTANFPKAA